MSSVLAGRAKLPSLHSWLRHFLCPSRHPPTPRSGAYWSCPFIGLIWPGRGALRKAWGDSNERTNEELMKYMGISEAYGRAIGTNFGFSSIAQSPPPEPELPLPERGSGALAREGGKRAKLAKPTLRTSGSSMLIAKQPPQQQRN